MFATLTITLHRQISKHLVRKLAFKPSKTERGEVERYPIGRSTLLLHVDRQDHTADMLSASPKVQSWITRRLSVPQDGPRWLFTQMQLFR